MAAVVRCVSCLRSLAIVLYLVSSSYAAIVFMALSYDRVNQPEQLLVAALFGSALVLVVDTLIPDAAAPAPDDSVAVAPKVADAIEVTEQLKMDRDDSDVHASPRAAAAADAQ